MKVATHLSKHPKIEWVRYPGLSRDPMHRLQKTYLKGKGGPLVVIGLKGGRAAGEKMINSLKLFSHVANVGDAKSLAIHPASTTHSQLNAEAQVKAGIPPEMVRLSVGLEDPKDLIADLTNALEPPAPAPKIDNREYLESTKMQEAIRDAVAAVLKDQPENPMKALSQIFGDKA